MFRCLHGKYDWYMNQNPHSSILSLIQLPIVFIRISFHSILSHFYRKHQPPSNSYWFDLCLKKTHTHTHKTKYDLNNLFVIRLDTGIWNYRLISLCDCTKYQIHISIQPQKRKQTCQKDTVDWLTNLNYLKRKNENGKIQIWMRENE